MRDMLSLLDDITEVGYVHWENILGKIIEDVTSDQIQILQERLGRLESRSSRSRHFLPKDCQRLDGLTRLET